MAAHPISPAEPATKYPPRIQPNAHPYPILTTSSALLSRSTSSPHSARHTRHHYVPPPPSRIPRVRHHHSSSLSSIEGEVCDVNGARAMPTPLPTPPPADIASLDDPSVSLKCADQPKLSHRVRRAETMPSSATTPITGGCDQKHKFTLDQDSRQELFAGLPPNPKQWNTDELVTYLEAAFKLGNPANGDKEGSGMVDILECVRARNLTGRSLLRLTDAYLADAPLSDAQRAQLLDHSRTLRAHVLRRRISADHSQRVSAHDIHSQYPRSASFHNIHGASASADDLHFLLDNNIGQSESILPPSPFMSLKRSNSVSEATAQRYRDLARMRMRRRGKVKGLVETWERVSTSESECSTSEEGSVSESEVESESEIDREFKSVEDSKLSPESPSDLPSALQEEPPHFHSSAANPALAPQEPSLPIPPPPYTHIVNQEEEPSIEELLASSSSVPLRGARAWEADFDLGETVKRIPVPLSADADNTSRLAIEPKPDVSCRSQDDEQQTKGDSLRSTSSKMLRSTGSRKRSANARKRVVTAIFTGSPPNDASEGAESSVQHHRESAVDGVVRGGASASSDPQNNPGSALRVLEESIAATRTQLEAFRLRLEEVEADTSRQEEILTRARLSGAQHSSNIGLKQRCWEANGAATTETADTRGDEIITASNKDVLEGMSLADIARALVTKAIGWSRPYGHLGVVDTLNGRDEPGTHTGSRPGANNRHPSPANTTGGSSLARVSCSIIFVSFAICAAVLRRMGFGRWIRRP